MRGVVLSRLAGTVPSGMEATVSLLYVAGYQSNLLQRAASITVTNENANLPKSFLYDGTGLAFAGSSEVSPFNITIDLGELIPNGTFESAFVGGLPTAAWVEIGGGTYTRNTATPRTGAGCLQASGALSDFAYFDVVAYPGQAFKFEVASRVVTANGTTSTAKVHDITTSRELFSTGAWGNSPATPFHENATESYVLSSQTFTVEAPEGGPLTHTLRFEFYCDNQGGSTPLYDDVVLYFGVNFASIHWHNLRPYTAGPNTTPNLRSSTDNFSGSDTLEAAFTVARPAFHKLLSAAVYRRYWRLALVGDSIVKNAGAVPYIGELVLGYAATAARAQDYGWTLGLAQQQVRTHTAFGAESTYQAGQHEQRRLGLQFKPSSAAEFLELRDRWYRLTQGGALPLVVVPYNSDDVVIHGRLGPELGISRELVTRWGLSMEVLETCPSLVIAG